MKIYTLIALALGASMTLAHARRNQWNRIGRKALEGGSKIESYLHQRLQR